ncbi:hypothetical protein LTR17_019744 [Elasticomyces elasticus]|nr:hypothetical protein LTR17_019744 [Elasticomyces elasticus]
MSLYGGAAGLALALRLSEVKSQTVVVLEAGQFPDIVKAYTTTGAGQQVLGGRGVGGSTLVNGLTYGRCSSSIYDLWQDLGNEGWDWDSVLPYFEKSTSFVPVDVAPYQTYNASAYSDNGPIALSYPTYATTPRQPSSKLWKASMFQQLMLSGIGPQAILQNYGSRSTCMQDHFYFSVIARAQTNNSASQLYNRVDLMQTAQQEYSANHSGPLKTPIGPTYGFRQLSTEELQSLGAAEALANQTAQAQIEYLWEDIYYPAVPSMVLPLYPNWKTESFIPVTAALLSPVSRGNVTLQTNTIQDAPAININYLESTMDQQIALFMFRSLRTVLSQPVLCQHTVGPDYGKVVPGVDVEDDATILEYIKSTLQPVWQAAGTCRMLPRNEGGVVDGRLRVYGVDGLRVIDASIFPVIPDNHTQGPGYMVAEKAADTIKEDYNLN